MVSSTLSSGRWFPGSTARVARAALVSHSPSSTRISRSSSRSHTMARLKSRWRHQGHRYLDSLRDRWLGRRCLKGASDPEANHAEYRGRPRRPLGTVTDYGSDQASIDVVSAHRFDSGRNRLSGRHGHWPRDGLFWRGRVQMLRCTLAEGARSKTVRLPRRGKKLESLRCSRRPRVCQRSQAAGRALL